MMPENSAENNSKIRYDLVRKMYDDEKDRTARLDEQARNLVGSILVVIGFLLAAGTVSMIDMKSFSSIFYFLGISSLLSSVFLAYLAFKLKAGKVPVYPGIIIDPANLADFTMEHAHDLYGGLADVFVVS
jgi:hypothetical protein